MSEIAKWEVAIGPADIHASGRKAKTLAALGFGFDVVKALNERLGQV